MRRRAEPADRPADESLLVTEAQATAFRLGRHHLRERAPRPELSTALAAMGGAQAQLLSAAALAVAARVAGVREEAIARGLWEERTLAKAWCMRRTAHLLPAAALAVFVRGSARRAEKEVRWLVSRGNPAPFVERLVRAVLDAVDEPRTATEIAEGVGRAMHLRVQRGPWGGWGSARVVPCVRVGSLSCSVSYLLHMAGARGVVLAGPDRRGEATQVRADAWVPGWKDRPVREAETGLLRTYLAGYGPATPEDYVAWTRMRRSDVTEIWRRLEPELHRLSYRGKAAWVLRRDLDELLRSEPEVDSVRLLPYFDSFLLGHLGRDHLMPDRFRTRVYRPQGWVAPTVLVEGRVVGTWEQRVAGGRLHVTVAPFSDVSRSVLPRLRTEVDAIGRFLGLPSAELRVAGPVG